jgi:amidohydrolase
VAVKDGATFGSTARFAISVQGKGGHAAMPELCKDPLVAAAALVCAAQTVISRNTNPFDTAVLSFTRIESGSAWNIVPDTAFIEGTIRGLGEGNCKRAAEQLERMCGGIALAYNVSIDFKPEFDSPSTNNDKTLCDFLWKLAEGNGYEVEEFTPTLGGEDFAYYQKRIPGVFFCFGVDSPFGLHHPKFQAKTDMLFQAARLMALIAESALARLAQG